MTKQSKYSVILFFKVSCRTMILNSYLEFFWNGLKIIVYKTILKLWKNILLKQFVMMKKEDEIDFFKIYIFTLSFLS